MARHAGLRCITALLYGKWLGLQCFERILDSSGLRDSIDYRHESLYLNIKVKRSSEKVVNFYQI